MSTIWKSQKVTTAQKLMAAELDWHRERDAMLREVKRLRREVGTVTRRYNEARREAAELVHKIRQQPPPPIPLRPSKEEEEDKYEGEKEKEKGKGKEESVGMEETRQEEEERQEKELTSTRTITAPFGPSVVVAPPDTDKRPPTPEPITTPLPSPPKSPGQTASLAKTPGDATQTSSKKRRFVETNSRNIWARMYHENGSKGTTRSQLQKYALGREGKGDKILLLLPMRDEGEEGYVCRLRKKGIKEFKFGVDGEIGEEGEVGEWD